LPSRFTAIEETFTDSRILAGYDRAGVATNGDASIGRVFVVAIGRASDLVPAASSQARRLFGTARR
jgi:hypothetical protein